jgi:hypothetical protein
MNNFLATRKQMKKEFYFPSQQIPDYKCSLEIIDED